MRIFVVASSDPSVDGLAKRSGNPCRWAVAKGAVVRIVHDGIRREVPMRQLQKIFCGASRKPDRASLHTTAASQERTVYSDVLFSGSRLDRRG